RRSSASSRCQCQGEHPPPWISTWSAIGLILAGGRGAVKQRGPDTGFIWTSNYMVVVEQARGAGKSGANPARSRHCDRGAPSACTPLASAGKAGGGGDPGVRIPAAGAQVSSTRMERTDDVPRRAATATAALPAARRARRRPPSPNLGARPGPPGPRLLLAVPAGQRGRPAARPRARRARYSPTTESRCAMVHELSHYVHGKRVPGASGAFGDVHDPNTGRVQARVPLADRAGTEAVSADARQAQLEWGEWSPQRRARVLLRFLQLVEDERDGIARALSAEHGKTVPDAHGDLQRGLEVV